MKTLLLQELSNHDIDWLVTVGEISEIPANTVLMQPGQPLDALYILLTGTLAISLTSPGNTIMQLTAGELVGAIPGLDVDWRSLTTYAATPCLIAKLPRSTLLLKLNDDTEFAAHLYRASAILLASRIEQLKQKSMAVSAFALNHLPRNSIALFSALQDDDLDWLIAAGKMHTYATDTILVQSGRPLDDWSIVLEGGVAVSVSVDNAPSIAAVFTPNAPDPDIDAGHLSRGDTIGEMEFIQPNIATMTVKTTRETQVLAVPRWRLAAKLLHDPSFAARFYQVLTALLANQQQTLIQRTIGQSTTDNQEFDSQFLTRLALAEARFEWMLQRLQTKTPLGGEMKW